jgi:hypothetical protein
MPVLFIAALVLAIAAKPAQLHDLLVDLESVRGRCTGQALGELFAGNFKGVSAALANEKLALMRFADFATGDEGVARFDAMNETVLDEKVERAVDSRGRDAAALRLERGEQIVGTDGLAGGGDERVHLAPQLRERQLVLGGVRIGAGKTII